MQEVLILLQVISIMVMFVVEYFIIKYWSSKVHAYFFICATAIIVNNVGYLLEMIGGSPDLCFYGTVITYLGKPFICASMFLFSLQICRVRLHKSIIIGSFVFAFLVFILAATSDLNQFFYTSRTFIEDQGFFPHNKYGHGIAWYIFIGVTILYQVVIYSVATTHYKYVKTTKEKKQVICILVMSVISILGMLAFIFDLTNGYDTTSLSFLINGIVFCICMVEYNVFESLEVVKEYMIDSIDEGIIAVQEDNDEIFYYNDVAQKIYPELNVTGIRTLGDLSFNPRIEDQVLSNRRIYDVSSKEIIIRNRKRGDILFLKDVTDSVKTSLSLQSEVNKKERDILRIQKSVIMSLADMVEARDGYTGSHIKNTKHYVKIIVDALKMDGKYKDNFDTETAGIIVNASPLHDIGKISVADTILSKKGTLTEEEFNIMKKHTVDGANIITSSLKQVETEKYINIAKNIALYHHEKWDGTGYPEGLSEEDIPLAARIMAVADVYDALTSKRCYKAAYSHEIAKEIMMSEKGTHFEGYLVDVFFENLNLEEEKTEGV